jgi:hypothetical protein
MAAEHADTLASMANKTVDPEPLVPHGFTICNGSQEEDSPQRVFIFLGTTICSTHENIAIAILEPAVDPVDYPHVANAIHSFLVSSLRLCNVSISPYGMGAALVSFASTLDC